MKIYCTTTLARSVVNINTIAEEINRLCAKTNKKSVRKWLKTIYKKYLLHEYPIAVQLKKYKISYPTWLNEAIGEGRVLYYIRIETSFKKQMDKVLKFLIKNSAKTIHLNVPAAIKTAMLRV